MSGKSSLKRAWSVRDHFTRACCQNQVHGRPSSTIMLHRNLIAVGFFAIPTVTFRILHVFLVLAHERRKILHFNVTDSLSASWTARQLIEGSLTPVHPVIYSEIATEFMAWNLGGGPPVRAWNKSSLLTGELYVWFSPTTRSPGSKCEFSNTP